MNNTLAIVMYHYIRDFKHSRYPQIKGLDVNLFEQQLQFLKKNYSIVSMQDVILAIENKQELPSNSALLTFDDGYAEHFTIVYPMLRSLDIQGSFFLPAKTVLEHKVLDVNKIHFVLASGVKTQEILDLLRTKIQNNSKQYSLLSFDEYYKQYAVSSRFDSCEIIFVKRMLQTVLPEKLRNEIVDFMFVKFIGMEEEMFARELYMSLTQCKQLIRDGMHLGCHGYEHYWWDKLSNDALEIEIQMAKIFLSTIGCDMENWTACYPYGSVCENAIKILKREKCKLAFTTEVRFANLKKDLPHRLPRLDTNDFPPKSNNYINL